MKKSNGVYVILFNTVLLLVVEIIAHHKSKAVSILGEVFHMAGDLLTVFIGLSATYIVTHFSGGDRYPFGLARLEVLATAVSLLLIWGPSVYLIKLAITRYFHPVPLNRQVLLITASFSLVINLVNFIISIRMSRHCGNDMSVSSIYVHALSDLTQCLGLFLSGLALYFDPSLVLVDLVSACFSTVVCFCGSLGLAREVGCMLLDRSPVDAGRVRNSLLKVKSVGSVSEVRVWDIGRRARMAMVKVCVEEGSSPKDALIACKEVLRTDYAVTTSNVEIS